MHAEQALRLQGHHLAQCRGPFLRVTLAPLAIARIGHETLVIVGADDDAPARHADPELVLGLAARLRQYEFLAPDLQADPVMESQVRTQHIAPVSRHDDLLIVAGDQAVAEQILVHLRDEPRRADDARFAATRPHVHQGPGAPGMVSVVMGENNGVDRLLAQRLDHIAQRRSCGCIAGIDQDQAGIGLEQGDVDKGQPQQPAARPLQLDLQLGPGISDRRRIVAAVHLVGNRCREIAAERTAPCDRLHQRRILADHCGAGQFGGFIGRKSRFFMGNCLTGKNQADGCALQ